MSPVLVPGGYVFIAGKSGTGYVLRQGSLGGIGGQVSSATVCTGFGGAAQKGGTIYVPCTGSLREVQVGANGTLIAGWQSSAAGGPPVIGGGAVWSVNTSTGVLFALDPSTGATLGSISVGAVPHFVSPTLWQDRVLVGTVAGVSSVGMPPIGVRSTYHPITPVRILDTRSGNGLPGKLTANVPATFQVSGRGGIPVTATSVTGNVTVANPSLSWALYLGPGPVSQPATSTVNFVAGHVTSNGVTVALSSTGSLSATYMSLDGNTTDLVFDVTGYFTPDASGATYHSMTPARLLDTRFGNGRSGRLLANTPATFQVAGRGGVPVSATAVTGNLIVVKPSFSWAVYLGPAPLSSPTTSTINFDTGQVLDNSLNVSLGPGGTLSATYISFGGNTTDLVLDVTGYYTSDATGSGFVPLSPVRLLDTRSGDGLSGKIAANTPATFDVAGRGGVPANATGVTGNATVVDESFSWAVFLGATPTASPSTSTINFEAGDVRSNGSATALGSGGTLSATYISTVGNSTDLVFDVSGYFAP